MINSYPFFYRLGHCFELSRTEYNSLSTSEKDLSDSKWILGQKELDVNRSGSLVYGGLLLKSWKDDNDFNNNYSSIIKTLLPTLQKERPSKRIGLVYLSIDQKKTLLYLAKKFGYKNVAFLNYPKLPNFGHWKQSKNWLIVFETSKYRQYPRNIHLGLITSYANQQFWARLDMGLPHGDMNRGIINLKLARSLLNLTEYTTVWDPFAGQGRIATAGLDIKKNYILSDIDESCLVDIEQNFSFAKSYWTKNQNFLGLNNKSPLASLLSSPIKLNATCVESSDFNYDFSKLAVVTEGYLGKNFIKVPTKNQMVKEWEYLYKLWNDFLKVCGKLMIPEIIFCLPFYQAKKSFFWPPNIEKIILGTRYDFVVISNDLQKRGISYSRSKSITGHYIIKLKLNS